VRDGLVEHMWSIVFLRLIDVVEDRLVLDSEEKCYVGRMGKSMNG
jgi:hypothetical protein